MKWYAAAAATIFVILLTLFAVGEVWNITLVADPSPQERSGSRLAALTGVATLMADAVLPVPSSLVMIAHGALFGVGLGTLLSVVGSMGAAVIGFSLGRRGDALVTRFVATQDRTTADRLLTRWGALAIIVTRPVPLLAETVIILAGASPLGWRPAMLAALVGTLPTAVIYALTGAAVISLGNGAFVLAAVAAATGCAWLAGQYARRRIVRNHQATATKSPAGLAA